MGATQPILDSRNIGAVLSLAQSVATQPGRGSAGDSEAAKERARLNEIATRDKAAKVRREAERDVTRMRREQQHSKGRAKALWGKSGLALSGAPRQNLSGLDAADARSIEERREQADEQAQSILAGGRTSAAMARMNAGARQQPSSLSTILGLGQRVLKEPWLGL